MSHLTHLSQVLTLYLPETHDLDLLCKQKIDHLATHGSLHHLVTTTPLLRKHIDALSSNPNVVDTQDLETPHGRAVILLVSSDLTKHYKAIRSGLEEGTSLYWWIQISHQPTRPPQVAPPLDLTDLLKALHRNVALLATAPDLRRALQCLDRDYTERIEAAYERLDAASQKGHCEYHLVIRPKIPSCLRIVSDGSLMVVHSKVSSKGPWIVTDGEESIQEKLAPYLETLSENKIPLKLDPPLRVSASKNGTDIETNGDFSQHLILRLAAAMKMARNVTLPIDPFSEPVPADIDLPRVRKLWIWVRTGISERRRAIERISVQVLSVIQDPPPPVHPSFYNVNKIYILHERTAHMAVAVEQRRVVKTLKLEMAKPGRVLATVNLCRITQDPADVDNICSMGNVWTTGIPNKPSAWHLVDGDARFKEHVELCRLAAQENSFYREGTEAMERWINFDGTLQRDSIEQYMQQAGLTDCVILVRVSDAQDREKNTFVVSLTRQAMFAGLIAPKHSVRRLSHVSISSDDNEVLEAIGEYENALIIITALDRVTRKEESYATIQETCRDKNNHLVSMLWPPDAVARLVAAPNPLLSQLALDQVSFELGSSPRSLPSVIPTLIACPAAIPDQVMEVIQERLRAAAAFVPGFQGLSWQGNNQITPMNGVLTEQTGITDELFKRLETEMRRVVPDTCQIVLVEKQGSGMLWCVCRGSCGPQCRCPCQECKERYENRCECGNGLDDPCPCRCNGHH